ncbi:MAG: hypothetical protein IPO07_31315 [Haliscomenobacter sp.]|nr:hypothetical protein [Haliscomenobacter sp.]MBK9492767.1 hypothetical protein [Haliscomenobacter sp.]
MQVLEGKAEKVIVVGMLWGVHKFVSVVLVFRLPVCIASQHKGFFLPAVVSVSFKSLLLFLNALPAKLQLITINAPKRQERMKVGFMMD